MTYRDPDIESFRRRRIVKAAVREAFTDAAKGFAILVIAFPLLWVTLRLLW